VEGGGTFVLCVDDDETHMRVLQGILESQNMRYEQGALASGRDAQGTTGLVACCADKTGRHVKPLGTLSHTWWDQGIGCVQCIRAMCLHQSSCFKQLLLVWCSVAFRPLVLVNTNPRSPRLVLPNTRHMQPEATSEVCWCRCFHNLCVLPSHLSHPPPQYLSIPAM
jgi:hypothetical protein